MAAKRYTKTHEWCALEGATATFGISTHAAAELNDLTYLDLRVAKGQKVARGAVFGEVDSVKATSELFAPMSGTVTEVNERFKSEDELATITRAPETDGWLIRVAVDAPAELDALMTPEAYAEFCAAGGH